MTFQLTDASPFDDLRLTDENGEYWSARDLMAPLGYTKWERFEDAIDRAMASARAADHDVDQAFSRLREKGAGRPSIDYRLSRFGAYLIAMNGDPRKEEIASAQTYFAIKTREAEVAIPGGPLDDLEVVEGMIAAIRADRQRIAAIEEGHRELTARMDGIEGLHDWFSALGYAKLNGLSTERGYLRRLGIAAGRITRRIGFEPAKTQHDLYGEVNTYPVEALHGAVEVVGGAR